LAELRVDICQPQGELSIGRRTEACDELVESVRAEAVDEGPFVGHRTVDVDPSPLLAGE